MKNTVISFNTQYDHFPLFIRQYMTFCRFWLCTFTLTVSLGAVLLLPMSICSNEIMIMYPNSYYIKWLNGSLIHGK